MSLYFRSLGVNVVSQTDGSSIESDTTPWLPGTTVIGVITTNDQATPLVGTCLIEGSDTGAFGGEEVTLLTGTSDPAIDEITLSKFMRYSQTAWTSGGVDIYLMSAI